MSILLTMNRPHTRFKGMRQEIEDIGTCLNCKYQGTESDKCNKCKRAYQWKLYKAPENLQDNFSKSS